MNLSNSKKKKSPEQSFIFRGKKRSLAKTQRNILIQAILMLTVGINLLVFLYTLPGEFVLADYLEETWVDLSQGVFQLIDALSKIGGALVVLILVLLGFILVLGSLSRFARLFFTIRIYRRQRGRENS